MDSSNEYDAAVSGWLLPQPAEGGDDFGLQRSVGGDPEAIARVREWVRERFKLDVGAAIMVSQVACNLPGCPPLETVVAFWENETRYHFKLFKPVTEVTSDNLPFAWMKESLIVPDGFGCECC